MPTVLWLPVLFAVFVACRWSGRLLDHHYADRAELGAVALIGLCVFGPFLLGAGAATLWVVPVRLVLALAIIGGLLVSRGPGTVSHADV
jgi:hypothetical protein